MEGFGSPKIQLEGDAKNIVNALNSMETSWSKGGQIVENKVIY
jgi:hypothetical protein